jgi:probable phosphoglycerate mutase
MDLYVTRHGQTEWNANNKVNGVTDIDLNETGIRQARTLAEYIAKDNLQFDIIISSPLKRALKTAQIIGEENSVNIIIEERLIEQNYGIYEGVDRRNTGFQNNKRNFAIKFPGGESMMLTAHRIYGLLEDIKAQYPDKKVLLVCHGGVCRIINTYFEDLTNDEFYHWQFENTQLKKYDL